MALQDVVAGPAGLVGCQAWAQGEGEPFACLTGLRGCFELLPSAVWPQECPGLGLFALGMSLQPGAQKTGSLLELGACPAQAWLCCSGAAASQAEACRALVTDTTERVVTAARPAGEVWLLQGLGGL